MTETKTYRLSEVAQHNSKENLWLVIHNKVYNITEYLNDHPGGGDVLIDVAGTDATKAFEDVGHSNDAREIMEDYYLGDLHEDDRPKLEKKRSFDLITIGVGVVAVAVIAVLALKITKK